LAGLEGFLSNPLEPLLLSLTVRNHRSSVRL
jgi:hypothetical protein